MNNARLWQQECIKELKRKYFPCPFVSFPPLPPLPVKKTAATKIYIKTCSFCQPDCFVNVGQVPSQICHLPSEPCCAPRCWGAVHEHLAKCSEMVAAFLGSVWESRIKLAFWVRRIARGQGRCQFLALPGAWPGLPKSLTIPACERQVIQFLFTRKAAP